MLIKTNALGANVTSEISSQYGRQGRVRVSLSHWSKQETNEQSFSYLRKQLSERQASRAKYQSESQG